MAERISHAFDLEFDFVFMFFGGGFRTLERGARFGLESTIEADAWALAIATLTEGFESASACFSFDFV